MDKVAKGLFVSVTYTGTLGNGEVFDSNADSYPLEYEAGAGQMIKGLDEAVMGMALKEKKKFTLAPEDAYGHRDENGLQEFPRSNVPPNMNPDIGDTVTFTTPEGHQLPARLVKVDDTNLIFDLNHPLAGESLTFDVEVVAISETRIQQNQECGSGCDCGPGGCDSGSDSGCSC
jgi:peptidylprolyl isomerase